MENIDLNNATLHEVLPFDSAGSHPGHFPRIHTVTFVELHQIAEEH